MHTPVLYMNIRSIKEHVVAAEKPITATDNEGDDSLQGKTSIQYNLNNTGQATNTNYNCIFFHRDNTPSDP